MYDVLIIGAGIVGTAIARRLSRYQLSVCLVEKSNDVAMAPPRQTAPSSTADTPKPTPS